MRLILAAPLLAVCLWPAAAAAQEPLDAARFEAYVTGKTLFYGQHGFAYGVEEYLPGRRVRWSFLDGACIEGEWYQQGRHICFAYETRDAPQCWEFYLDHRGLTARVSSDPEGEFLYEVEQSSEPMECKGPMVGV
jgi:hypothetical protein